MYEARKSFLKRLFKDKKTDKVYYDGKQAKINEKLSDSRRGHQRMVDSAPQEETDSVLEVDAQPEEASGAATTTPPVWSP
ncbi:hypothetical protein LSH36_770g01043 [Paralvinella palmiformis]|uniref:Uncharacterized protein n=1 Tax=Paralvinella palmiformis TaxID=53620 RepID=A0AAD9J0G7_9ANNE|nr:hypothetical protein LSH36_770g01043 [Paralvinella palmiformis]